MEKYEILEEISENPDSWVWKVKNKENGEIVVAKRCEKREIEILKVLKHVNVVTVLELLPNYTAIFENCPRNLYTDASISNIHRNSKDLFEGLAYIHQMGFIHRDIKPENLLLDKNGVLKIADFGISRSQNGQMTPHKCTLWYRPMEMLLGDTKYTKSVDLWSVGCVLSEIVRNGRPIFKGTSEIDMLNVIINVLGSPNTTSWPELSSLPTMQYIDLQEQPINNLAANLENLQNDQLFDLIGQLLIYNPNHRISAENALRHEFFQSTRE